MLSKPLAYPFLVSLLRLALQAALHRHSNDVFERDPFDQDVLDTRVDRLAVPRVADHELVVLVEEREPLIHTLYGIDEQLSGRVRIVRVWLEVWIVSERKCNSALACWLGAPAHQHGRNCLLVYGVVQRLPDAVFQGLQAPWDGIAGEHIRLGFEARQPGFLQRYGLMLGRRELRGAGSQETAVASSGVLVDWLGSWKRKRWTFTTRWVLDSEDLAPAVVSGFYLLRDARGRERLRAAYQRRDLGRDLTLDLDPSLGLSRHLGADEERVVYEDLSGRVSWEAGPVQFEATAAFRPMTSTLRLLSAVLGYRSPCECWGVALEAGWAGDIALSDETYGAPIVGLGFSGGSSRPKILERLVEVGLQR